VEIRRPERGEKKEIVDAALLNAREALGRRMAESGSVAKLLDGVAEVFALPQRPERIEVYDNSHIQGTSALGAMIVAGPDGFVKNQYRKFNMKTEEFAGDDFAMMKAMIRRRFARMLVEREEAPDQTFSLAEKVASESEPDEGRSDDQAPARLDAPHPPTPSPQGGGGAITDGGVDFSKERDEPERETKFGAWPDLVLIDGGEGQLAAAIEALEALGLKNRIVIAAIAKGVDRDAGRERFFVPGKPAFRLEEKSPVLYYLQRLRDEAHRFAIGAHRGKRSANIAKNPLDEIGGIGPARKRALLDRFGSARGVARAALAELEEVDGVSKELAKRIYDYFHDKR
jgi:excinuclease ABC subunit C